VQYHRGFARQVELWPENPVDIFIAQLKELPKTLTVADMGCGDAKIAQNVEQKVHSFDLAAPNKWVTACDVSKVPLGPKSVDVVIFCLALMGTNLVDFINEAHRILKPKYASATHAHAHAHAPPHTHHRTRTTAHASPHAHTHTHT
jgi:ribosomal RNA-processing protein 8